MLSLPSNGSLLSGQIRDCISTIATLTNCIRISSAHIEQTESAIPVEHTGHERALTALEESLARACSRLDLLMSHSKGWGLPDRDASTAGLKYFDQKILLQQQVIQQNALALRTMEDRLQQQTDLLNRQLQNEIFLAVQERLNEIEKNANQEEPPPTPLTQE
jgi:hypothetical protein